MNIDPSRITKLDDDKCFDELINLIKIQVSDEEIL